MASVPPVRSAALAILHPVSFGAPPNARATPQVLAATANGVSPEQISGAPIGVQQSQAQLSEAMFSVHAPNINQMKLDLYKKVGEALGVDQDAYETMDDYWQALRTAYAYLELQKDSAHFITKLEEDLGLDKLGVSLKTVIDSLVDPEANEELMEAFAKQAEKETGPDPADASALDATTALVPKVDEIGLYSA